MYKNVFSASQIFQGIFIVKDKGNFVNYIFISLKGFIALVFNYFQREICSEIQENMGNSIAKRLNRLFSQDI